MQAQTACQDAIPHLFGPRQHSGLHCHATHSGTPTKLNLLYNRVASATSPTKSFNRHSQTSYSRPCHRAQANLVLRPTQPPDSPPPQPLLAPHHTWARKWVPNAHAIQVASQAPRRYAGDPRRRWGLLGAESRGVGSGGLGTSSNWALGHDRVLARSRFASADARLLAAKSARETQVPWTRLAGPRRLLGGPSGPAEITDIPVRAAHGPRMAAIGG